MSKKNLIVNLAASHVSISAFRTDGVKLILEQFYTEDLTPALGDEEWINAATSAVARLASNKNIKGTATIIVPSFLLLQKALKVAQVESARQAQIIAFEAQNNIPYPLNEVVWDSQIMSTDGVEAEVLLFALRTDQAGRIANAIAQTGIRPQVIQAAPILDVQAQQFVSGGIVEDEDVLFINVGARTTGLSFISSKGTSIQAANLGGNLLTQGISDNTGQPVINAESLKVGFFTHVIQLPETDPQFAILEANKQSFNRRLSQDINRRLISIKRLGRRPTKIIITGRSSQVPGLSQQLSEALALPVEEFNPLGVISLSSEINAEYVMQHIHQLSEVVGEASRLLSPTALGVNLIPRDIAGQISFESQKIKFVFAALLLAIAPVPILLTLNAGVDYNKEQTKTLKKKSDELINYQNTIKQTREDSLAVLAVNQQLEFVVSNSPNWPIFLADLQSRVLTAKNTWIEELRVRREPAVIATTSTDPDASRVATNVTKITITTRTLLEKVPPGKSFKAQEFKERKAALLESLKKSPFVAEIPEDEIKVDFTKEANVPRTTLTLVIKFEKTL
ncbi:MAG: pilus assembly protein PilM [Opitutae bacterium]